MRWLMLVVILIMLSGCTVYQREIHLVVHGDGDIKLGDIEALVEVIKGDEQFTTAPTISPTLSPSVDSLL